MWRYAVGGIAVLLMAAAGVLLFRGQAQRPVAAPTPPPPQISASPEPLPSAPKASDRTREEKRFDRYDKDRDEAITLDELLATRRKAFAKLDTNGDGKLDFREWAVKTYDKFGKADADKSGKLSRAEFATTAVKHKAKKPACSCAGE